MKLRLKSAAPTVYALEAVLAQRLPQYRYAIRTGRLHQFLVVSGDSVSAALVVPLGKQVKVFGGFRNSWLHGGWILAMSFLVVSSIGAVIELITNRGASNAPASGGVCALFVLLGLAAALELARRTSRSIIRDVATHLQNALT